MVFSSIEAKEFFLATDLIYLGHKNTLKELKPDLVKIEAIIKCPTLITKKNCNVCTARETTYVDSFPITPKSLLHSAHYFKMTFG